MITGNLNLCNDCPCANGADVGFREGIRTSNILRSITIDWIVIKFQQKTCNLPLESCNFCTAAEYTANPAANTPFQWHSPGFPPAQNVDSAALAEPAASHFGGKYAKSAKIANICIIYCNLSPSYMLNNSIYPDHLCSRRPFMCSV